MLTVSQQLQKYRAQQNKTPANQSAAVPDALHHPSTADFFRRLMARWENQHSTPNDPSVTKR